jgi:hypothetical protein
VGPAGIVVASELPEVAEIEAGKVWEQSGGKLSAIPAVLGDRPASDLQTFKDEAAIKNYLYARQILNDQEIQMVAGWLRNRIAPVPVIGERKKEPDVQHNPPGVRAPEKPAGKVDYQVGPAGIVVLGEDAQEAQEVARQIWEQFGRKLAPVPAVLGQYSSVEGVRAFPDKVAIAEYLNGADHLNPKEIQAVLNWLKDRSKPVPVISEKKKKPPVAQVKQTVPPDKVKTEPAPPSGKNENEVRLVIGLGGLVLFGHDIAAVQAAAQRIYLESAGTIVPILAVRGTRSPAPGVMAFPDPEAARKHVQEANVFSSEEFQILKNWAQNPGSPVPRLVRRPAAQATVTTATPPPRPSLTPGFIRSIWDKASRLLFWAMLVPFVIQLFVLLSAALEDLVQLEITMSFWFGVAVLRFLALLGRRLFGWDWPLLIFGGLVELGTGMRLLEPEAQISQVIPWLGWQIDPSFLGVILVVMGFISIAAGIQRIVRPIPYTGNS